MYSTIVLRTSGGSSRAANILLITLAESPEPLCCAFNKVHAVLRQSPSARACWSSPCTPAAVRAFPRFIILELWRALCSAIDAPVLWMDCSRHVWTETICEIGRYRTVVTLLPRAPRPLLYQSCLLLSCRRPVSAYVM